MHFKTCVGAGKPEVNDLTAGIMALEAEQARQAISRRGTVAPPAPSRRTWRR